MASCTKCGANLIAQARFCASCGSPVASGSIAPPPSNASPRPPTAPDPFARTILGDPPAASTAIPVPSAAIPVPSAAIPAPSVAFAPPAAVSPMAASVMKEKAQQAAARPAISVAAASVSAPQAPAGMPQAPVGAAQAPVAMSPAGAPAPAMPAGAMPYAQPAPQQSHSFAPGALVLVYWADGNRYPGTVLQIAQHHVFVAFPNGMQQWIDARYVQMGS